MTFLKISKNLVRGTPEDAKKPILTKKVDSGPKTDAEQRFWPFLLPQTTHIEFSQKFIFCAEILRDT